jgi:lipopolysaccharide/colanic/teichoic acid biosynthesis glycosyltransferase
MRHPRPAADGDPEPDADRVTGVGKLLRSTSLDELPELVNVLLGDMSLVGPRPLLPEYLDLYSPRQARRHEVLPGLTGWAAVRGRNATSWEERLEQDVWYVENRSFILDMRILFATVGMVLSRRGVTPSDQLIMPKFTGSESPRV